MAGERDNPEMEPEADETVIPESIRRDAEADEPSPEETAQKPAEEAPTVGVIAVYSEATGGNPRQAVTSDIGWTYVMKEGDLLFLGRQKPPPLKLPDGRVLDVTHCHLFHPKLEYVSRRHLALEMKADGSTQLYDFSINGVFLKEIGEHRQRDPHQEAVMVSTFQGRQTLILGADPSESSNPDRLATVQVVPMVQTAALAVGET